MEPRRSSEKRAGRLTAGNQIDTVADRQMAPHQPNDWDAEAVKIASLRQLRLADTGHAKPKRAS